MRKIHLFWFVLWIVQSVTAQTLPITPLNHAAPAFMQTLAPGNLLQSIEPLMNEDQVPVGFLYHFTPSGFLIISASEKIKPVYAYSADRNFDLPPAEKASLVKTISKDLEMRIRFSARNSAHELDAVRRAWSSFLLCSPKSPLFEQWPPEGTTYTGGWLETNWTQNAPYNTMCPMDLNAGSRSYAGCPAVAMAQVINHHREINQTRFSLMDDYFHSFGSGNSFWIDDDYQTWDFPCFDTLNLWLDTLEATYLVNGPLTASLKAAVTFACGVAAQQVYSASVSGTYGLEQAIMAWQRFGFIESRLVYPEDTTLNSLIAGNIKAALPVQLGLLSSTGSGGHNVVVDGYNTDEYYHFNFGWGGSANGWYTLPPTSIPYNLTIIEGAVLDIKSALYTVAPGDQGTASAVHLFPNPFNTFITVCGLSGNWTFSIIDLSGKQILTSGLAGHCKNVNTGNIPPGCYIYRIINDKGEIITGKIIKETY